MTETGAAFTAFRELHIGESAAAGSSVRSFRSLQAESIMSLGLYVFPALKGQSGRGFPAIRVVTRSLQLRLLTGEACFFEEE